MKIVKMHKKYLNSVTLTFKNINFIKMHKTYLNIVI